ncbi:MAG: hypothetical protein ACRC6T_01105 [Sarcina sp.]
MLNKNKKMEKIIDINILLSELLSITTSKGYKKEFRNINTVINSIKKVFINNKNLRGKIYKLSDFLRILEIDLSSENKEDLEYEFLRKSEISKELIASSENEEYMIIHSFKKMLVTFVYEKFRKIMFKDISFDEAFAEIGEIFEANISHTLFIVMSIYSELHRVEDVKYYEKINELYIIGLERKINLDTESFETENEKIGAKLKKMLEDLDSEREAKKEANNKLKELKKKYNSISDDNKSLMRALEGLKNKINQPVEFTDTIKKEIVNMISEERDASLQKSFDISLSSLNKKLLAQKVKSERLNDKVIQLEERIVDLKNEMKNSQNLEVSATLVEELEEVQDEQVKELDKSKMRFFARVLIEDNRYYLKFNGGEYEFIEEDESRYYVQGELVVIDGNKKVVELTDCYDDKIFTGLKYAKLQRNFKDVYVQDAYGNKLFDVVDKDTLSTASIIAYNSDFEIKIVFKKIKNNIDLYKDCIEAKKHKPLIVMGMISSNLLVRNALTSEEEVIDIKNIDKLTPEIINASELLIVNKDYEFIGIIDNSNYYTYSKNYDKKETVVVKYVGEIAYADKLNGERVKLNYYNRDKIDDGAVCIIDEFNNILYETDNELSVRRAFRDSKVNNSTGVSENIEITDEIAIVGRTNYKDTYKLTFLKNGVNVKFVDGNENYSKVQQVLRGVDKIIVCVTGVSHGNMWSIKEHYKGQDIRYADADGANRLYEEYLSMK